MSIGGGQVVQIDCGLSRQGRWNLLGRICVGATKIAPLVQGVGCLRRDDQFEVVCAGGVLRVVVCPDQGRHTHGQQQPDGDDNNNNLEHGESFRQAMLHGQILFRKLFWPLSILLRYDPMPDFSHDTDVLLSISHA